jgi:hypothetical protein
VVQLLLGESLSTLLRFLSRISNLGLTQTRSQFLGGLHVLTALNACCALGCRLRVACYGMFAGAAGVPCETRPTPSPEPDPRPPLLRVVARPLAFVGSVEQGLDFDNLVGKRGRGLQRGSRAGGRLRRGGVRAGALGRGTNAPGAQDPGRAPPRDPPAMTKNFATYHRSIVSCAGTGAGARALRRHAEGPFANNDDKMGTRECR